MMERSDVVEIGVAIGSVGVFVAALAYVSDAYAADGTISTDGALPLVAAVTLFILVMAVAGLWLSRQDS